VPVGSPAHFCSNCQVQASADGARARIREPAPDDIEAGEEEKRDLDRLA
jgi:hypothetical protein